MSCKCLEPNEPADPRRKGTCICGKRVDPSCLSSDETLAAFLDHLEHGLFPRGGNPSPMFAHFRALCEKRERDGRDHFGLGYLRRDNAEEAGEEGADLAMYMHLSILQARQRGEAEEWSTAVEAARHAFLAYEFADKHATKRKGSV